MTDPVPDPAAPAQWPSFVRTFATMVVGAVASIAANHGMRVSAGDQTAILPILTAVFGFIYYAFVRLLETKKGAAWGWLLGSPHAPVYPTTDPTPIPSPPAPPTPDPSPQVTPPAAVTPRTVTPAPAKKAAAHKAPAKAAAKKAPAKKGTPRKAPAAKKAAH